MEDSAELQETPPDPVNDTETTENTAPEKDAVESTLTKRVTRTFKKRNQTKEADTPTDMTEKPNAEAKSSSSTVKR